MFDNAVIAMTSSAEKRIFTVSTALESGVILQFLAATLTSSNPLEAPLRFKLFSSFSIDDMLV